MGADVTIYLDDRELAALDRHIATAQPGRTRAEALSTIVSLWAETQPRPEQHADEGLRPDELNASNDS